MKIPSGREMLEQAFKMDDLYNAIGRFIFVFSQLEATMRMAIVRCLKLKEGVGDAVTAPYDFVANCRVASRLLKDAHSNNDELVVEIDDIFKQCLKLNEQRIRIVHGFWIYGSSAWHTSRTTLKASEYFTTTEEVLTEVQKSEELSGRLAPFVYDMGGLKDGK